MISRHQFFLLIHILCCAMTIHGILLDANDAETCNLLCVQCNATAVFANGHCECNFDEGSDEVSGSECLHRIQKEIQAIELNMLSEDLTDEERNVRSILKYRRRLRPESAPYVSSIMHGAEMYPPILRATNPAITYPTTGLYDPFIQSPLPIHHALVRAVTLPAHVLHHVLHPRLYHHHRGIVRSTNLPSDTSDTGIVGQPICENNGDSTSNLPTARNNANKLAEQNVGFNAPSQYPYITHAEQPTLYHLPHTSYYSPLMNMLHPISGYVFQPVSQYTPPDPLTSASNPQSSCGNYANTEQRSVLTTDKAVYSNDETEKSDDATRNISKDEKKNGTDKS
ncbi:uncharacterized protein LOC112458763 isoform X1 [Temnothorax curvispinosus]|uniref:Uncharacterized protein LOC112458763 isoform X1 n=1 Tax=Temnothorax curvispinosus TaxID=300111 RepID=A0A6J1Q7V1_9HYME|nr:uncharacterized protein LOC112458763 isoform X1 [Temnothorax curvispinosus]